MVTILRITGLSTWMRRPWIMTANNPVHRSKNERHLNFRTLRLPCAVVYPAIRLLVRHRLCTLVAPGRLGGKKPDKGGSRSFPGAIHVSIEPPQLPPGGFDPLARARVPVPSGAGQKTVLFEKKTC